MNMQLLVFLILSRDVIAGGSSHKLRFRYVMYVYNISLAFFDIWYWKGVWDGYDCLFGFGVVQSTCTLLIGTGTLTVIRRFR